MKLFLLVVLTIIFSHSLASAQTVSVRNAPGFADLEAALKELVTQESTHSTNLFYVSPVELDPSAPSTAWVYWPNKKALILFEPGAGYDPKLSLVWSRRYLDLKRDVVPTIKEVAGSNFLLSRAEAAAIVASCKSGDKFVIEKAY